MRLVWILSFLILAGCGIPNRQPQADSGAEAVPLVACSDPRPQVCTMEYAPVCAELSAGGVREYASGCSACADAAVSGYRDGSCPQ